MKKKQTKTGPKSVTGFSILKIYLQEKQQKEDWILNRKRRNRAGFFLGILLLLFGSMPAAAARQESEPNQLFATAACLMDGDTGRVLFGKRKWTSATTSFVCIGWRTAACSLILLWIPAAAVKTVSTWSCRSP